MIQIKENSITLSSFPFPLTSTDVKNIAFLDRWREVEFKVYDYTDQTFSRLLKTYLQVLLESYNIYFTYVEAAPQAKSLIRTRKKMFYDSISQKMLSKNDIYEFEAEINEKKSLIAGLIRLHSRNLDYCLSGQIIPNLRFGYMVDKTQRSFPVNRSIFLQSILKNRIPDVKTTQLNMANILIMYPNSHFFIISSNGKDEEILQFLIGKADRSLKTKIDAVAGKFRAQIEN